MIDIGLVTDALWTDFDDDSYTDLILAGEWMSVSFFKNMNGKFQNVTNKTGIGKYVGWWISISGGDFNDDGNLDIFIVGNDCSTELMAGRQNSYKGLVLKGNGRGEFQVVTIPESGINIKGDMKSLAEIKDLEGNPIYLITKNRGEIQAYRASANLQEEVITVQSMDQVAYLHLSDGSTRKHEFYYGSSYLSQSTRNLTLGNSIVAVDIVDSMGTKEKINRNPNEQLHRF